MKKNLEDKTKENFTNLYDSNKLTNPISNKDSRVGLAILSLALATPVCAYLGSYVGEGIGWLGGNIIDYIPLANNVAPWLAERSGLIQDAKTVVDINENFYQAAGSINGFWAGLFLPWYFLPTILND